jgi:succinoglycan biosynthesis transport protein ExoP
VSKGISRSLKLLLMQELTPPRPEASLPAVLNRDPAQPPAAWQYQIPPSYGPEPDLEQPGVPLSHYLWILRRHRYKITAFVAVCVFGTYFVSTRLTPIYEAITTVDVDRQAPPGVVGQDSQRTSALNDADQFLATQIKLIQSDSVLRPVAEKYNLLEREKQFRDDVSRDSTANAPVLLKKLRVTRPPNTYLLLISYRSPEPNLAAEVANAVSNSYIEHTYTIRIRSSSSLASFMEKQLEELRAKMEVSSSALMKFEREMNIINPEEKTSILSARLLQLNTEYTTAQGDRVRKEVAYHTAKTGTIEAAMSSTQGETLKKLMERQNEAEQKFSQIKEQYGARHQEFKKSEAEVKELRQQVETGQRNILKQVELEYLEATHREIILKQAVAETKTEYDKINARSFEYQQLKREAEADKQLYEELVRKIRESSINAGFQSNSIRLADYARPPVKPVFPNMPLNLTLAFLFSAMAAIGAAVVSDAMDKTIRDPEQIAQTLNAEVLGSLPMVREKDFRPRLAAVANPNGGSPGTALVLSGNNGHTSTKGSASGSLTLFEESMRTLHSSILLSDLDHSIRSLLVTSTAPGEGKSTTAAYLAISNAEQGHSTLLIDGDLRRPSIHRIFGVSATVGLSSVLLEQTPWKQAVAKLESHPNLDILPAGPSSRRAPDLVARGLEAVVEEAGREYSMIVIDSPPFLNFAEPLRMSTIVDGVLLVTVAGQTNRQAVASVVATLKRVRANMVGLVLNKVTKDLTEHYHYYGYYGYYGKYYKTYYTDANRS